jgi:hypothetical protein
MQKELIRKDVIVVYRSFSTKNSPKPKKIQGEGRVYRKYKGKELKNKAVHVRQLFKLKTKKFVSARDDQRESMGFLERPPCSTVVIFRY